MADLPVSGISTAAGVPLTNILLRTESPVTADPDPRTCVYTHLDLTTEQLGATKRYNCWGFTFLPRRYWINSSTDVDNILRDNCDPVADGTVQTGDVIRYRDNLGVTTHTGRIWETDGAGHATKVRSKWGSMAEYCHLPLDVPVIYGTNLAYFRQKAPLHGVTDLWVEDSPTDDGEQQSGVPFWTSPDILVDLPPYDGSPDPNPAFNHANRVWAVVHNRSDRAVSGVFVRYYWADPAAGLAPADWHLIPATAARPNPVGPLQVPANASIEAPYVEWTPTAAPAHQCLLAIAYINDDPTDSSNPDPLVYPFDIAWENNIAQRNVTVVELAADSTFRFEIDSRLSPPFAEKMIGALHVVLTHRPRLPILGLREKAIPLAVTVGLDGQRKVALTQWEERVATREPFYHNGYTERRLGEKFLAERLLNNIPFVAGKPHKLTVELVAPKDVRVGSVYHLHITQLVDGAVRGGYTVEVVVV